MKNPSSKTEGGSDHPLHDSGPPKGDKVDIRATEANPGPVIPDQFTTQQEGTKEERRAEAQVLNQDK